MAKTPIALGIGFVATFAFFAQPLQGMAWVENGTQVGAAMIQVGTSATAIAQPSSIDTISGEIIGHYEGSEIPNPFIQLPPDHF